jgi:molybdopterin-guanine dinucleotide biosynthesis protein A
MDVFSDISGVILAGGRASRFGSNKAFARFHGIPIIFHVWKTLRVLFPELILVTNTPHEFRSIPAKTICDDQAYQGPLGGIATALRHAENNKIFVVACDMPLLDAEQIGTICQYPDSPAIIPYQGEKAQYLMSLYSKELLAPMDQYLAQGHSSLKDFFRQHPQVRWVPLSGTSAYNVNTEADLHRLEAHDAL